MNIDDFVQKMIKSLMKYDACKSDKVVHKTAASKTLSKQATTSVSRSSQIIQSLSSESQESPKSVKDA